MSDTISTFYDAVKKSIKEEPKTIRFVFHVKLPEALEELETFRDCEVDSADEADLNKHKIIPLPVYIQRDKIIFSDFDHKFDSEGFYDAIDLSALKVEGFEDCDILSCDEEKVIDYYHEAV